MRRYNVERSCNRCHERKVRCDKATPCMTCVRAKVPCQYPGPERAKRRSHKTSSSTKASPHLELLDHTVAAIDATVSSVAGQPGAGPQTIGQSPPVSFKPGHARGVPSDSEHSGGFLLKEGASTRYINEFTFSRVLEKQGELQSAIDTPESNAGSEAKLSSFGLDGLLSSSNVGGGDIFSLFPTRWQATQLWQIYLNNVDGLVKLLHVPTVQPKLFASINNPKDTPLDLSALFFAIYFAAVTSLRSPDTLIMLGQDLQAALNSYQRGLEVCLYGGSFLDSPTVASLQAMAIYLMCRRNSNSGRSGWILNGLLIRAAQSIGLHRDGEQFHLSPLETEVRRRLWWQILGSDGRVAEDHGLSAGPTGGYDGFCDTKLPTHLDDRDLSPDLTIHPGPRPRWTEMTHFLVASEMYQSLQQINRLSAMSGQEKMTSLQQLLNSVKSSMQEKYLQYCDINIPIQKCALLLGRLLIGKFEVFIQQQHLRGLSAEESAARASDETLALACGTIELGLEMKTDEMLNNFQWLFSTFAEYHVLTYALWHLCVRPEAFGADRTWAVVNRLFMLAETQNWPTPGSKWNVCRKMRERAAEVRQTFQKNVAAAAAVDFAVPPPEPAPPVMDLQQIDHSAFDASSTAQIFTDGMVWDFDALCFPAPDWGIPNGY